MKRQKHSHYFRIVRGLRFDFYRLCELFGITHQAQTHALKKIMFAGVRPDEAKLKDIQEAIESLERWKEMLREDEVEPGVNVIVPLEKTSAKILAGIKKGGRK